MNFPRGDDQDHQIVLRIRLSPILTFLGLPPNSLPNRTSPLSSLWSTICDSPLRQIKSLLWSLSLKNGSINQELWNMSWQVWPGSCCRPAMSFLREGYSFTGSWLLNGELHASHIPFIWRSPLGTMSNGCRSEMGFFFIVHKTSSYVTLDAYSKGWFQDAPGIVVYNHLLNEYISVFPPQG